MTRQTRAAAVMPLLLIVMTALLLAGCGGSQGLAPVSSQPLVARTRVPVLFHDAAETTFLQPAEPLTDGPAANLHGLYGSSGAGDTSLGLCRLEGGQLLCRQYATTGLDAAGPLLVEASGEVSGSTFSVGNWQPLDWDEAGQRAVAQAELETRAAELASYQWDAIARPEYADSTKWFKGDEARFSALPLALYAYDMAGKRIIWRAQGWEFPQQEHLVHRYPVVYIVTDPAGKKPPEVYATIEGYVEE
ncbi:MAG: hypothetical protein M9927_05605 [Anaerolineae bacterium]|nr:hypothetical protein [Anaerolineae bacterium]HRX04058.1 hypothetical protein [Anaerolineae bacterium]